MTIQDLNASLYAASLAGLLIILQTALTLTVGLYRGAHRPVRWSG